VQCLKSRESRLYHKGEFSLQQRVCMTTIPDPEMESVRQSDMHALDLCVTTIIEPVGKGMRTSIAGAEPWFF
jgi:hypothetical protein